MHLSLASGGQPSLTGKYDQTVEALEPVAQAVVLPLAVGSSGSISPSTPAPTASALPEAASIVRREEDSTTGELLSVERMLTLNARERLDGEPPSEFVMEDFIGGNSWAFDATDGYTDFAAA